MNIKGLNTVIAELRRYGKEAEKDIEAVTEQVARNIEKYAKENANAFTDNGDLAQSINAVKQNALDWKIIANNSGIAPYVAYVEFGTGGLVDVPQELQDQAIKFKGKGIKQINLRPRPYLYPAFLRGSTEYVEKLKKVLDKYGKSKQVR